MGELGMDWPVTLAFTRPILLFLGTAAWPISAAVIAFRFEAPIRGMINRAKILKAFGFEAELPPPPQIDGRPEENNTGLPAVGSKSSLPSEPPTDPLFVPFESEIDGVIRLAQLPAEANYRWAVRAAAVQGMLARHERDYRLIYGSQIAFLKHLNVGGPVTMADANVMFGLIGTFPAPLATYTFENWLAYLVSSGDVERYDTGNGEALRITMFGRAFLLWMTVQAVPENKAF